MSSVDQPASKAQPPRMVAAARAESMPVEDVVNLAAEGRLRMPSFQRAFRWETADRRALIDSIYRGYPVGTLLLWKNPPSDTEAGRPLAEASSSRPGDQYLVVDGQQRLTTLWEALGRRPRLGESALLFDMEADAVVHRPLTSNEFEGTPPPRADARLPQVPLYLVLDAALLSGWVPQWLSIEDKRRYFEFGKRVREYRLGLYVVEHADVDTLRHVFDRVNTTGKPMLRNEVFDALIGSQIAQHGSTGLALVNAQLSDLGFGAIEPGTILKAFEAIRGDKVGRLDPRALDVAAAEADLIRTARALRPAIRFLQEVAHMPHVAVRPYELPLVVLARFFALHAEPNERNLTLLRRWLWRGALGERLGGASSTMQQHVDDVTEKEDDSVRSLLVRTGSPADIALDDWDHTASASIATARGKMLLCALLARHPRNLLTGERLQAQDLFGDSKDDLMRSIVRESGDGAPRRGIVNKLLHPKALGGPAAKQLILECTDEAALLSHGIDVGALEALRSGDLPTFYDRRGDILRRATQSFFAREAELERDDAPSLASLVRRSA